MTLEYLFWSELPKFRLQNKIKVSMRYREPSSGEAPFPHQRDYDRYV